MAIERWRALAPQDPEPCLLSNEIASRSDADSAVLIQNYRAALERDPKPRQSSTGAGARIGQGSPIRRSRAGIPRYLKRKPKDTAALLGLGRNAFQQGKIEEADRYFEKPVQINPRDPETLKELGQIDLRLGRIEQACERLKLLGQIEPYDHEVRYLNAQALKLAGDADQFKEGVRASDTAAHGARPDHSAQVRGAEESTRPRYCDSRSPNG